MSQEIEIGLGKKGRLGYSLDDVSIIPSRRTRDPQDVSTNWQIDAYEFDAPVIGNQPCHSHRHGQNGRVGCAGFGRFVDPV